MLNRKSKGPMIFKITSTYSLRSTYVGVLEFIAEEGTAVLPNWIFENLQLEEGNFILIN
jgi:ubiquitin fusion degradation protein 1